MREREQPTPIEAKQIEASKRSDDEETKRSDDEETKRSDDEETKLDEYEGGLTSSWS